MGVLQEAATVTSPTRLQCRESAGIAYLANEGGHGNPLVLLHGIGSNAQSFAALMQAVGSERPILAWDAPGYGRSQPLPSDWPSADDYAEALGALLDRLGIRQHDLLGHSLGALIAGRFAVRHPELVAALYLVSPALGYRTTPHAPLSPPAANRLTALLEEGAERFAASRGPKLLVRPDDIPDVRSAVIDAMSQVKLPGYAQASRMLSCADLIADAAGIETTTIVAVGEQDTVTPPANCRRVYDALIAATPHFPHRFELIAAAGHAVVQEQPAAVARLVAAALDGRRERAN